MSSCVAMIDEMVNTAEGKKNIDSSDKNLQTYEMVETAERRENTSGRNLEMGTGEEIIDGDSEICEDLSDNENDSGCDDELSVDSNVVNGDAQQKDTNIAFERINTAV